MVATYPPTSNNADTSAQAAVLDAADSTYSLLYFDSIGICAGIRNLLALSGAQWTQLYPQDWMSEDQLDKTSTPFEVIPVLYVHSKDGSQTVAVAETKNIELFLAQKFNCLGKNTYERSLICAFVSSASSLVDDIMHSVTSSPPEMKQQQMEIHMKTKVPKWIRIHEEHLLANGHNGHYVGDTISLADLRTAAIIDLIKRFPHSEYMISSETTPALVKVKETVDNHPKIKQWYETELFKSLRPTISTPPWPRPSGIRLNDRQGNKTGGLDP
ncbi:hypothetical protein BGZ65_008672 [Modicella reniformis]|uniref:Glutathione transferase n=1 Tax=Modicella reniformis TaxID=1440133 RepID=A0A9P6LRT2_9FUNG|nr:hypothetical protein BGZ65_008672 [Modicella reniformis]